MAYMTKQQQAVLACIRGCADGVGAAELTELLHQQGETVGLTTVYRHLERLEKAGKVHKIVTDSGAKYQLRQTAGRKKYSGKLPAAAIGSPLLCVSPVFWQSPIPER